MYPVIFYRALFWLMIFALAVIIAHDSYYQCHQGKTARMSLKAHGH
jgi:hypothetical protein